jgi:mRNA interferase RelE/StbE
VDNFEVVLAPQALKFYKKCALDFSQRLNKCFEDLETNPFFGPNIKLLKAKDRLYRYRLGDHRVIYEIDKPNKKVIVVLISARPTAYRNI